MNANLCTKKIEMTKSEAKEAGKLNTEAFKTLRQYMEMYPGYEIQIKASTKRKVELKGLDYDYMRNYIQQSAKEDKSNIYDFYEIPKEKEKAKTATVF